MFNRLPPISQAQTTLFGPTDLAATLAAVTEEERKRKAGDITAAPMPGDVIRNSPAVQALFGGMNVQAR